MGKLHNDGAASIRYALASQSAEDGRVEIILDLYRGSVPALTRKIAVVERGQAKSVLSKCQRHLEKLGAHAVANFSFGVTSAQRQPAAAPARSTAPPPKAAKAAAAPLAAFDWMFQAG